MAASDRHVVQPSSHRFRGPLPKVGIRPTIDGRYGGVRESLEDFTRQMAQAAAELIERNLRHAAGDPVECVIPDFCIGGVAESADCAALFEREGVGVSLTVTPCWCYGAETIDMDPSRPKAIWGFNGTDRPGAVYLAAALAAHTQKGLPCFGIYGRDVQDLGDLEVPGDVQEKILRFVRAGLSVATMKGKSYLAMGGVSMGIAGSIVEHRFFERWLGMRVETVDMTEFVGRMREGIYDRDEFEAAMAWVRKNCREGKDWNPPQRQRSREQKDGDWATSVQMALIARDLMVGNPRLDEMGYSEQARGHNAIAGGFQGQRQWTDYFPNGDFMEAILCSSVDWTGIRQPFMLATENDALNGASMLLGHLLTGTAQMFSDVRTFWSPEAVRRVAGYRLEGVAEGGFLHLINSGTTAVDWTGRQGGDRPAVKPWWEVSSDEADACLEHTLWCPSDLGYFPGGGWSTDFTTRGGIDCTMFRINLVEGLGPVLQIAEGRTIDLPEEVHRVLDERTNPTWPTTWFVPRTLDAGPFRDVYTVMNHWGANHGAIAPGHIGADLIALAAMLRIPVDMHNVPEERVFRPSSWARFGAMDVQGADYRACSAYGPLYR
jgi:L-fucose/D-arabinose isomerase